MAEYNGILYIVLSEVELVNEDISGTKHNCAKLCRYGLSIIRAQRHKRINYSGVIG